MVDISIERAKSLRKLIERVVANLDDKSASEGVELSPKLSGDGSLISAKTRIQYNGKLYRASSDVWDTAENTPDKAPSLWEEVQYKDGIRIIPSPITVTSQFAKDELGLWTDGKICRSKVDANVYTPAEYPDNWELYVPDGGDA